MSDPAVILHKGQKLAVESDTTEIFQALKAGKLEEVKESGKKEPGTVEGKAEPSDADNAPVDAGKGAPEVAGKEAVSPESEDTAPNKKRTGGKNRPTTKDRVENEVKPFL